MPPGWTGHGDPRLAGLAVARLAVLERTARMRIETGSPVDLGIGLSGDELTRGPIQHIEEAILGSLQDDLAHLAVDAEIGQSHLLHGRVIPALPGCVLEVPNVLA